MLQITAGYEINGAIHNHVGVKATDEERQKTIESDGIQVLRFTSDELLNNLDCVISRIQNV